MLPCKDKGKQELVLVQGTDLHLPTLLRITTETMHQVEELHLPQQQVVILSLSIKETVFQEIEVPETLRLELHHLDQ